MSVYFYNLGLVRGVLDSFGYAMSNCHGVPILNSVSVQINPFELWSRSVQGLNFFAGFSVIIVTVVDNVSV
jgi:hypothetical protein